MSNELNGASHPDPRHQCEQLVGNIDGIVWEGDARTFQFLFVSQQAERLLGYPLEDWLAPGFWVDHVHPEDRDWALEFCLRMTREKRSHDFEYRMVSADGRTVWLRDLVHVVVENGEAARLHGVMVDITSQKLSEIERQGHLRFLENMDRVNRALQGGSSLEEAMGDVLETVLSIFECDRAWVLYPCDPDSEYWRVTMERTRPEYPGAFATGLEFPVDPEVRAIFRLFCSKDAPIAFGPGCEYPVPEVPGARFRIQSQLAMAVHPKVDKPYVIGIHQCSRVRVWTPQERRLFQEIGRRLADTLGSLLTYRDLQVSESRLEQAQHIAHVGYWERDVATNRFTLSEETHRIFGLEGLDRVIKLDDWIERWPGFIHPDDRDRVLSAMRAALQGGPPYELEYRVVRPSGEVRVVHSRADITCDGKGNPRRVFGIIQDITDLRTAERELLASEARFRTFVDHATDAFFLRDEYGTILDVNRQASLSLGYTRQELVGIGPSKFDPSYSAERCQEIQSRLDQGEVIAFDSYHRRKDGSTFPVEVSIRAFSHGGHKYTVSLVRDITRRKRAEQALIESHSLLNAVVEGTLDVVFVKDLEGRYLLINSAGARFIGKSVDEIIGKDDHQLISPESAAAIMQRDREIISAGRPQTFEESATASGQARTYLTTKGVYRDGAGRVIGLVGMSREITEIKRLEEQFSHAQKMEAIGQLAGGVAHDFNNLLTVINGYAGLVLRRLDVDDPNRELLVEVQKCGERAANLTRQLLAFSRKQVLQPQVVNINTLIDELRELLKPLVGQEIDLVFASDPELGMARVDPGQFEQAILNLAVNARDAMEDGGRLIIETRNADLDPSHASRFPEMKAGRYVMVAVSDSGLGMDEQTRSRIFEPFFTTKGAGKGTGLGLAMVYGFVKQSGGHVEVYSEMGRGTTLKVYLPRAEESAAPPRTFQEALDIPRGSETVLVVEDEDAVRKLCCLVLQPSGYTVIEAHNGREAIEIAGKYEGVIHLLLTDLAMPGMGGGQLAEVLALARPEMRIIFMSGYTDEAALRHGALKPGFAFVQKPFSPASLARKVREVLDHGLPRAT